MSQPPLPPSDEPSATPEDAPAEAYSGPGRRAVISREDLIQAAMKLVGPPYGRFADAMLKFLIK